MARKINTLALAGLLSTLALAAAVPAHAQDSRQRDKNNMRNLGIALGAIAAQQVLKGNTTSGAVLGAGAAYAGKKYEDARKAQGEENRDRRYYRDRDNDRDRYEDRYNDRDRYEDRYNDRYDRPVSRPIDRQECRDQDRDRNRGRDNRDLFRRKVSNERPSRNQPPHNKNRNR